ncbi:ParB/RepB/Spo0J family partition protein [Nesterenkonia lacusekhoensis]|uniref:ParB family chromosome partitioning protein n=1 Tax=Nesterenkonia lacusekhoensis TaxID=150832 RepID=A0ABS4T4F0_9MICC|nr:ParB/RepB/Spo0J family partition protein [Nesterenkonia lacusekhoensis]MBP2319336.1 ParB family chromosome partitioning protein [Nesterenkonia lacusekhoensis]
MAERKRRGLGRGLGALINTDAEEEEVSGAAAQVAAESEQTATDQMVESAAALEERAKGVASRPKKGTVPRETTQQERETGGSGESADAPAPAAAGGRPIDVFFSAKSNIGTQTVSRETRDAAAKSSSVPRTRTAAKGKRAEMPDVLGQRRSSAPSAGSAEQPTSGSAAEDAVIAPAPQQAEDHSWTDAVSRETGGAVDGAEFRSLPVASIQPNSRQPRTEFDEEDMAELVHSVREIGVLQPIVVRPLGDDTYELVMGERRWRASKVAERETIPAIVRSTKDDDLLRDALLENIHRSELNPLEEAAAYRQLLDDFSCTQDELSTKIGRSRPQISNTLRLMKLPPTVQRRVAAGVLSSGHARALLGLQDDEQIEELAARIVAEGLSVRATEEAVTLINQGEKQQKASRDTKETPQTARQQQLAELSDALIDRLDTQVKISLGAKKGRISIDFASMDDLHRLMELIGNR